MPKAKKPGGMFANLSGSQRRRVEKAIIAAKGNPSKPTSVQASIPYLAMSRTGFTARRLNMRTKLYACRKGRADGYF